MAYDRARLQLTAIGKLGPGDGTGEDFQWGLHLTGAVDFDALQALADFPLAAAAALYATYHGSADTALHPNATLYNLKLAAIQANGEYFPGGDARLIEVVPGGVNGGGVSTRRYPNQCSLVISLRTTTNIGVAVRGRYYLPLPTHQVVASGRIDPGAQGSTAASTKTFLDALNVLADGSDTPSVLSLMSAVGTGVRQRAITQLRVGDVIDTQRSRRNQLDEEYTTRVVVVP